MKRWLAGCSLVLALQWLVVAPLSAEIRLKELGRIEGWRDNSLIGYGLVTGLAGTGDSSRNRATRQSIANLMSQFGVVLPNDQVQSRNVAAVMVTATLPAFAQPGQQVDVTVSSLGNAKSLRGGTLLMTPLKGADGQIYAVAQGNVLVGGAGAAQGGSKVQINHLSAGRVPSGATVERAVATPFLLSDRLRLELNHTDFSVAATVAETINDFVQQDASDGFILIPHITPGGLAPFVDKVVPLLQERGVFRADYTGSTLRDHLGLATPTARETAGAVRGVS